MTLIPRQKDGFILTDPRVQVAALCVCLGRALLFITDNMFENIPDIRIMAVIFTLTAFAWMASVVYSRYQLHIKDNMDKGEEKLRQCRDFAFVPYLIVPMCFVALSVVAALFATDYATYKGFIAGECETAVFGAIASIVAYSVFDRFVLRNLGNALYFHTIEDKVTEVVQAPIPSLNEEETRIFELVRAIMKK